MLFDVSMALKDPGQLYSFELALDIPPTEVLDDPVEFVDVSLSGHIIGADESVALQARLTATAITRCALCLEPVRVPVDTQLSEVYVREPGPDDDRYPLDGYKLDPAPMVQEALLLELPLRIVCGEDCRGLCPVCGINLNTARCTCQEGASSLNPFSALSELLKDDEEV